MANQSARNKLWRQIYRECREDIFAFCKWLGFKPTPQQRELLELAQKGDLRIACKSGQGPGKTTVSVIIGLWWCLRFKNARTIITAPSMKQCKDVWLTEARRRMEKAHPLLKRFVRVTKSRVKFGNQNPKSKSYTPDWECLPITATTAEAFQGLHQDQMNAIVEEASGMSREIIEALMGTVSNTQSEFTPDAVEGAVLMIGNPNTRDCVFFDCFNKNRARWKCLTFNAEDSPIVSKRKIKEHEDEWGRDSDAFRVRVLGEFPSADPSSVINPDDLDACTRTGFFTANSVFHGKQFGIDLARKGDDESVIYRRLNGLVIDHRVFQKKEPIDVVREAFRMQREAGWSDSDCVYVFDAHGPGQGVAGIFYEEGKRTFEFYFNGKARRRRIYTDKITEAYFLVARMARDRTLKIPRDDQLISQLSGRQYEIQPDGRLKLEAKKVYMKRTGERSPDRADAFVLACYLYATEKGQFTQKEPASHTVGMKTR